MFRTSGLEYKFLLVFLCVFGLTVGFEDNFWDESLPNGLEGNFSEPIRVPGEIFFCFRPKSCLTRCSKFQDYDEKLLDS